VAKSLLTDYRDQFEDLNPFGMVRFVAEQVLETVAERSAARELIGRLADDLIPGRDDGAESLGREEQLSLFGWREEHVVSGVARG
jgi:acyl-CoA oxidase